MNYYIENKKSGQKIGPFTEDDIIIKEIGGAKFYCHRTKIDESTSKELVLSEYENHTIKLER
jgi:hypothetical protein